MTAPTPLGARAALPQPDVEPPRQFKGVWFCADLWENRELTWTEKALLAEIDSLSGRGQACFAGNEHLAERLNVKPTHMREMLAKLTDLGYLVRLAFDGRRTLRCVNPEVSSNPTASRHLMEAHQVPESSYRIKPKAQGKYRLKPRSGIGQNRDLE